MASIAWVQNTITISSPTAQADLLLSVDDACTYEFYISGDYSDKVVYSGRGSIGSAGDVNIPVEFLTTLTDNEYSAYATIYYTGSEVDVSTQTSLVVQYNLSYDTITKNTISSIGRYLQNIMPDIDVYSALEADEIQNNLGKPMLIFTLEGLARDYPMELASPAMFNAVTVTIQGLSNTYASVYDLHDRLVGLVTKYPLVIKGIGEMNLEFRTSDFEVTKEQDRDLYYFTAIFDFKTPYGET